MKPFVQLLAAALLLACTGKQKPDALASSQPTTRIGDGDVPDDFELGGEAAPVEDDKCNPFIAPVERRGGDLVVHAPPDRPTRTFRGRLRNHTEGTLSRGSVRLWVGPQVPGFVPLTEGTQELFLLDHVGNEFLALYRDPYGASTCTLGTNVNCGYTVVLFDRCGEVQWTVRPNALMSASKHLEIQDVRYEDGVLYFNEACQSYSSDAKGKCSALVAVDPKAGRVSWRTPSLTSNGEFLVHGDHILAGYGFTRERDHLFVVRRSDGKVVVKRNVASKPDQFTIVGDDIVDVTLDSGQRMRLRLENWNSPQPRLGDR